MTSGVIIPIETSVYRSPERGFVTLSDGADCHPSMSEITRVINAFQRGDAGAADELVPLIYAELRHLAAAKMAWICQRPGSDKHREFLVGVDFGSAVQ